jgi:putative flippase GtrA
VKNLIDLGFKYYSKYRHFILYSIIGFSGVFIDFIVFFLLHHIAGVHYLAANVLSVSCGISNNFLLNSVINFRTKDRILRRFLTFYAIGVLGLLASSAILWLLVDLGKINVYISKGLTIFIVVIIQYSLNKKFTFKK